MQVTQLALDPKFPSMVLSDLGIVEMGPASQWCDRCGIEAVPVAREEDEEWIIFPCHQIECSKCYEVEDHCTVCDTGKCCCDCWHCDGCEVYVSSDDCYPCENCGMCNEGCCECYFCQKCDGMFSSDYWCGSCSRCENDCECAPRGDCDCGECGSSYGAIRPGWVRRGDDLPRDTGNARDILKDHLDIDPVQAMADFYLTDYALLIIGPHVTLHNNGPHAAAARLRNDAYRLQSHIVARCDAAFRAYGYLAIGGELRHHRNVRDTGALPSSRETSWDYWTALGDALGRDVLLVDALELFGDGSWGSGYGGTAWHTCTEVLLARETRQLDAKTFVDRVFSLQHNGGSFLNKSSWSHKTECGWSVSYCHDIGNAHAARHIDFGTLLGAASEDVRGLILDLVRSHSWTFGTKARVLGRTDNSADLERLKMALGLETQQERDARAAQELEYALAAIDQQYA